MRLARKLSDVGVWLQSVRGPRDWPNAVALALLRTRPPGRVPPLWIHPRRLGGLGVLIDPSRMSHYAIYDEVFVHGVYDLDRVRFEPDVVIDCGAFEGYFSLLARARYPTARIVAFEPNAENHAGLVANVMRNRASIETRAAAVSTRDGLAMFDGGGCGGHLVESPGQTAVSVPLIDLMRYVRELAPVRLLLKIDIEGEERTLLPAILDVLPRETAMFFEWHHGESEYRTVAGVLKHAGFTMGEPLIRTDPDGAVFIDAFAGRQAT